MAAEPLRSAAPVPLEATVLSKVLSIRNVGRLRQATKPMPLEQFTLVYAENGRGKSTLAAILRSAKTADAGPILERRSLRSQEEPAVKLLMAPKTQVAFDRGAWTQSVADLEVFDAAFVHANVYSGNRVDIEHRRNLYRFAVGDEGASLAARIDEIDAETRKVSSDIASAERLIRQHLPQDRDLNWFLKLERDEGLGRVIETQRAEIAALEHATEVFHMPAIAVAGISEVMQAGLDSISSSAARLTRQHISEALDDRGEQWLQSGLGYTGAGKCPFCGRDLCGSSLVCAYEHYFSSAYGALKQSIQATIDDLEDMLSEARLLQLQRALAVDERLAQFWTSYVELGYAPPVAAEVTRAWTGLRSALLADLNSKLLSPLDTLALSAASVEAVRAYEAISAIVGQASEAAAADNVQIAAKRTAVSTGSLKGAGDHLRALELQRVRHEEPCLTLCREYQDSLERKKALERQKRESKRKLDQYATAVLEKYESTINQYLVKCNAGFRICEAATAYSGGRASAEYVLEVADERVELASPKASPGTPDFGNTLSVGDRSTLAFAFFMARLDQDARIAERMVVLDDPVSSLDANRRRFTTDCIVRLCGLAQQVIVLTHDSYFARQLWDSVRCPKTSCQLRRASGEDSNWAEWDIETETQGEYYRNYFMLVEYSDSGPRGEDHMRSVARCIRPLIEGNLRLRFPGAFRHHQWLGEFIKAVRESCAGDQLYCLLPQLQELSEINTYCSPYHHSHNPAADSEPINDTELSAYVTRSIKLIAGILGA
ncbi:MAG: AAA family ATPase [Anaerolineae bacterium]